MFANWSADISYFPKLYRIQKNSKANGSNDQQNKLRTSMRN